MAILASFVGVFLSHNTATIDRHRTSNSTQMWPTILNAALNAHCFVWMDRASAWRESWQQGFSPHGWQSYRNYGCYRYNDTLNATSVCIIQWYNIWYKWYKRYKWCTRYNTEILTVTTALFRIRCGHPTLQGAATESDPKADQAMLECHSCGAARSHSSLLIGIVCI